MNEITNRHAEMLNKESPAFKNIRLGTVLQTAVEELNAAAEELDDTSTLTSGRVSVAVIDGTNNTAVNTSAVSPAITSVVAVLAITKSSGAAATKLLQAVTTDYTFASGVFSCVGDKSALTLIIIYK